MFKHSIFTLLFHTLQMDHSKNACPQIDYLLNVGLPKRVVLRSFFVVLLNWIVLNTVTIMNGLSVSLITSKNKIQINVVVLWIVWMHK